MPIKDLTAHMGIKDLIARNKEKYPVNLPIRGQYFLYVWNYTNELSINQSLVNT